MADTITTQTPATTDATATPSPAAAPASPPSFSVPAGYRLTRESDYESLSRTAERAKGTDALFNEAKKHGFDSLDGLKGFLPLIGGLRSKNADIKALESFLLSKESEDDAPESKGISRFDPAKFEQDITSKLTSTLDKRLALTQHEMAVKGEADLLASAAKELAGSKASAWGSKLAEGYLRDRIAAAREFYPDNHPLHSEYFAPLTTATVKSVLDAIKKEQAESTAAKIVGKADSIRKTPATVPTSAGNTTGPGAPQDKPLNNRDWLKQKVAELNPE